MNISLEDILCVYFGSGFSRSEAPSCESYAQLTALLYAVGDLVNVDVNEIVERLDDIAGENAVYDEKGDVMFEDAEIDKELNRMVEGNIVVEEDLSFMGDEWYAYIETWFDVDARFGTNTRDADDYVNVYAYYNPVTLQLRVVYAIVYADETESDEIEVDDLTMKETADILRLMQDKCRAENDGMDMHAA